MTTNKKKYKAGRITGNDKIEFTLGKVICRMNHIRVVVGINSIIIVNEKTQRRFKILNVEETFYIECIELSSNEKAILFDDNNFIILSRNKPKIRMVINEEKIKYNIVINEYTMMPVITLKMWITMFINRINIGIKR